MRSITPAADHVRALRHALDRYDEHVATAERWGRQLAERLGDRGRLLIVGNGGSAALARHLAAELVGPHHPGRPPFAAICLSGDASSLTVIGSDHPPADMLARQVEAHGRPGDVLLLLSTSGRSLDVVTAADRGRALGLQVWAVTGPRPNSLALAAHECITVSAPHAATVQELHLLTLHLIAASFGAALDAAPLVPGPVIRRTAPRTVPPAWEVL